MEETKMRRSFRRRRRTYSRRSRPNPNTFAEEFIKRAFFNLSWEKRFECFSIYAQKYGKGPASYAEKTYHSWKSGSVGMSGQTARRVLEIVPVILPRETRLELLETYLPSFEEKIRDTLDQQWGKSGTIKALDLESTYVTAQQTINQMRFYMEWFVKDMFSEHEIAHLENVVRWLMLTRLRESFVAVKTDLISLHNTCRTYTFGIHLDYRIKMLGTRVKISHAHGIAEMTFSPIFKTSGDKVQEDVKILMRRKLVDARFEDQKQDYQGRGNTVIALHEVASVLDAVGEANPHNKEVETTLEIEAKGGTATLRIEKKSLNHLKNKISAAEWKKNGFVALCLAVAIWGISSENLDWGNVFFYSIFVLPLLWGLWESLKSDLKRANKELEDYERSRKSVFFEK